MDNGFKYIDAIVNRTTGHWKVEYLYNKYGENVLLLLPNDNGELVQPKNDALISLIDDGATSCFGNIIINDFIDTNPDQPFIIKSGSIYAGMIIMNNRLEKLWDSEYRIAFDKAADEFRTFLWACLDIFTSKDAIADAARNGWRKYVN